MNAATVLTSEDLFQSIRMYQPGRRLMVLVLKRKIWYAGLSQSFLQTFHYCNIERLVATLSVWYFDYGMNRLITMLTELPYMKPIVAYEAAYSSRLEVIQILHQAYGIATFSAKLIDVASYKVNKNNLHGQQLQVQMVNYLHQHRHNGCTRAAMNHAIANNNVELTRYLASNRTEGCDAKALWTSSLSLDMFQVLHSCNFARFTTDAMDQAAGRGDLPVVQFLHENRKEGCTTKAMDWAAQNGHLKVVQFLHYNRTEGCTTRALDEAARHGHVQIVQFLVLNRHEGCTVNAHYHATGNDPLLRLLRENRKLNKGEKRLLKTLRDRDRIGNELDVCAIS